MACNTCGPEVQGQCDACKLVDGDERFKSVFLCETCNAYLCATCMDNWAKRGLAAGIDIIDKVTKYFNLKFGGDKTPPQPSAEDVIASDDHLRVSNDTINQLPEAAGDQHEAAEASEDKNDILS